MTKRTVQSGMVTYRDPEGATRYGVAGEEVDVHADHVARFDQLNGGPPEKPAPAKRPTRKGR